jgi:hypothetical protein
MMRLTTRALGLLALALALLCGPAPPARADFILQPVFASTDMGTGFGSPDNVINQSGLSAPYTSGVTNFATYIASNPTHNSSDGRNIWGSSGVGTTGNFDFDLGGTYAIGAFALWNYGGGLPLNVVGFDLLAADNAEFSNPTTLGSFTANPSTGPYTAVLPEVFTFAPTTANFVRMHITSNNGSRYTIFGEAAFEVQATAVPEPSSLALLGTGAVGLVGYARRRRKARAA